MPREDRVDLAPDLAPPPALQAFTFYTEKLFGWAFFFFFLTLCISRKDIFKSILREKNRKGAKKKIRDKIDYCFRCREQTDVASREGIWGTGRKSEGIKKQKLVITEQPQGCKYSKGNAVTNITRTMSGAR